jgi:hypothetical protein
MEPAPSAPKPTDQQVFKIQVSLDGSKYLIYNHDQSMMYQGALTKAIKQLMGKRLKAYYFGTWDPTTGKIGIDEQAEPQPW